MTPPAKKAASYADVLAAPEHMIAEIIDGELHLNSRPGLPHTAAASALGEELGPPFEVLSPRTAKSDRTAKLRLYAREKVGWAWLVEPLLRTLEVFRLESGRWVLLDTWSDEALVRAEPFDAIELELAALWQHVVLPQR